MTDTCRLSCTCGKMQWHIEAGADGRHIMCYCKDCQTEARHLGQQDRILKNGGTQNFQTVPDAFGFDSGIEHLGLLRLSPKGLFRWYATCCNTPIANTLPAPTLPFVGAVLPAGHSHFGRVRAHTNTNAATVRVRQRGVMGAVYSLFFRAAKSALAGKGRDTPFFDENKQPVVAPTVLTKEQRKAAAP